MVADHSAAAQRRKADVALAARAGHAVASAHRTLREIDAAAFRRRAAEHQRGAGWRVDLLVVVHFEDFDIEIGIKRFRHALDQRREQIDAQTHIAGLDHHGALRRGRDQRVVLLRQARGADDVDQPRPRRELGKGERRCRRREVEEAVGLGEQWRDLGADRDVVLAEPRQLAGIAPDHRGARRLDCAGERHARRCGDRCDQRAPHAPAGAGHDQPHVRHRIDLHLARV